MTISPAVELRFNPTDLRPSDLPRAGAFLGSPADALEAALAVARAAMVDQIKTEMRGIAEPTHAQLLRIADLAWQAVFWKFRKVSAPIIADTYFHAYQAADAGDVPMHIVYDLADKHAEKIGDYFHESSREALAEGFNTLVNRRVPAKAAVGQVMDAYGLTRRQMRGYLSAKQFTTPVTDVLPRPLKARARTYIDKAFTSRTKKLAAQEEHNIDQQAQQLAWMWLQDKGRLSEKAQKLWITAKDERVCVVCGPLHGKKVGVGERFRTSRGEFWSPGLHPNCRCVVRLLEHRFTKRAVWEEEEHPRGQEGRFSTKVRTQRPLPKTKVLDVDEEFTRLITQPVAPVRHISYAPSATEPDTETERTFASLVAAQPKGKRGFTGTFDTALDRKTFLEEATANISATEPKVDFAADLAVELRAQTRAWAQTKPQTDWTKTPTQPLDAPVYAVIESKDLQDGDISRVRLNHGIAFHTDEITAAADAGQAIQQTVIQRIEDMTKGGARIEYQNEKTGERLYADLEPENIERVAEWYANTATVHHQPDNDPNFIGDEKILPDWRTSDGTKVLWHRVDTGENLNPGAVPLSWIGEQFELRSQDFEHYVVQVDRVPTELGAVEHDGKTVFIDGDYELVPGSVGRVVHDNSYAVTTFKLEPKHSVAAPESE